MWSLILVTRPPHLTLPLLLGLDKLKGYYIRVSRMSMSTLSASKSGVEELPLLDYSGMSCDCSFPIHCPCQMDSFVWAGSGLSMAARSWSCTVTGMRYSRHSQRLTLMENLLLPAQHPPSALHRLTQTSERAGEEMYRPISGMSRLYVQGDTEVNAVNGDFRAPCFHSTVRWWSREKNQDRDGSRLRTRVQQGPHVLW